MTLRKSLFKIPSIAIPSGTKEPVQRTDIAGGIVAINSKHYGNKIYYAFRGTVSSIVQIFLGWHDLDGTGFGSAQVTSVGASIQLQDFCIFNGYAYYTWSTSTVLGIGRSDLDGTNFTIIATDSGTLLAYQRILIDSINNQIHVLYRKLAVVDGVSRYMLFGLRCELDGSSKVVTQLTNTGYNKGVGVEFIEIGGTIYFVYVVATSGDEQGLWTGSFTLSHENFSATQRVLGSNSRPKLNGNTLGLYYTWYSGGLAAQVYYSKSNLDGTGFSTPLQISGQVGRGVYPWITLTTGSKIILVWKETVESQDQLWAASLRPDGSNLTVHQKTNDPSIYGSLNELFPAIVINNTLYYAYDQNNSLSKRQLKTIQEKATADCRIGFKVPKPGGVFKFLGSIKSS